MGELFQLFWGRGGDFPGIGPLPSFWPLWSASELSTAHVGVLFS